MFKATYVFYIQFSGFVLHMSLFFFVKLCFLSFFCTYKRCLYQAIQFGLSLYSEHFVAGPQITYLYRPIFLGTLLFWCQKY